MCAYKVKPHQLKKYTGNKVFLEKSLGFFLFFVVTAG